MGLFNILDKKKKVTSETKKTPKTAKPIKPGVRTDGLYCLPTAKSNRCIMFHNDKTVSYGSIVATLDQIMTMLPNWRKYSYTSDEQGIIHFYDDIRDRHITVKVVEDGIVCSLSDEDVYHFYEKKN